MIVAVAVVAATDSSLPASMFLSHRAVVVLPLLYPIATPLWVLKTKVIFSAFHMSEVSFLII